MTGHHEALLFDLTVNNNYQLVTSLRHSVLSARHLF